MTIAGNYTQGPNGVLAIEIDGTDPGVTYDVLRVTGVATLDGTLAATSALYTPSAGDSYAFMTVREPRRRFRDVQLPGGLGSAAHPGRHVLRPVRERNTNCTVVPGRGKPGEPAPRRATRRRARFGQRRKRAARAQRFDLPLISEAGTKSGKERRPQAPSAILATHRRLWRNTQTVTRHFISFVTLRTLRAFYSSVIP